MRQENFGAMMDALSRSVYPAEGGASAHIKSEQQTAGEAHFSLRSITSNAAVCCP